MLHKYFTTNTKLGLKLNKIRNYTVNSTSYVSKINSIKRISSALKFSTVNIDKLEKEKYGVMSSGHRTGSSSEKNRNHKVFLPLTSALLFLALG